MTTDRHTGAISNERPFLQGFARGLPDGSAMDAEGFLWNCRYYGNCVVRVAPDGKIDRVVEMPVKNITTCCFGGADLKTLLVTTASAHAPLGDRYGGEFICDSNGSERPAGESFWFAHEVVKLTHADESDTLTA